METENLEDEKIARSIFSDMLNNNWDACDQKIKVYGDSSPLLSYCASFHAVIKAILLFERNQFQIAFEKLTNCQKMCKDASKNNNSGTGRFSSLKRLLSYDSSSKIDEQQDVSKSLEDTIRSEIIAADCKLYYAALAIAQHSSVGSVIGGVLEFRRSWVLYEQNHKKLKDMLDEETENGLKKETVEKLLASVSYGYGIVQLCFSFLSNYLMRIANFFGFESDRETALNALHYTSQSDDIRAPMADACLILYSIFGVWLFGNSDIEMYMPAEQVIQIIDKNLQKCSESCLFFYTKAKYYQILMKDSAKALEFYEITFTNAKNAREIQSLVYYEIAILHLTNLDYKKAYDSFKPFSEISHWSKIFNLYINILLNGSLNAFDGLMGDDINKGLEILPGRNPIDVYSNKRLQYLKSIENEITKEICEFFLIELLYLWVLIPYCTADTRTEIKKKLELINGDSGLSLIKSLITGAILIENKEIEAATKILEEVVLNKEYNCSILKYTQPYAYCHLCKIAIEQNQVDEAKKYLKLASSSSNFELQDRLYAHMRSLNRQIESLNEL